MYTPFNKRATEYLPDGEAFLNVVTPDLFKAFLGAHAKDGRLFDRLVRVIGIPGSGKTTLAKVLQFNNATVIARRRDHFKALYSFLVDVGLVEQGRATPSIIVARLPMESEYRTFWGLPYKEDIRNRLLATFIQARAVLSWLQQIERAGISLDVVQTVVRPESPAIVESAGASSAASLFARAAEVERALYSIVAGIVPPEEQRLPPDATKPYSPFDALEGVQISGEALSLLVILDDFHQLSREQRRAVVRVFTRRELRIARWTMMRYDALNARSVIQNASDLDDEIPADVDQAREITNILMQDSSVLSQFSRLAPRMADQQLGQVPLLWNAGIRTLEQAVSSGPPKAIERARAEISRANTSFREKHRIGDRRVKIFLEQIDKILPAGEPEVRESTLSILLRRYVNRVPQTSLIDEADFNPEPNRPVMVSPEIVDAARVHLMHSYGRAYYFGAKMLVDAASGNAEQYLRLCDPLISALESLYIRRRNRQLTAETQHEKLRELAREYRVTGAFPENANVGRVTDLIANMALKRTLEETAPVPPGPNAIAIAEEEFDRLFSEPNFKRLAETLKFAIAYNRVVLRSSNHKGRKWTTLQLNGLLCIHAGLPFGQGNYVDNITLDELNAALVIE